MNLNDTFRYLNIGLPQDILRHKMAGHLDEAIRLIDLRLADENTPEPLRLCMIAQREMMLRTPGEFPFNREEALAELNNSLGFSLEEIPECTIMKEYLRL